MAIPKIMISLVLITFSFPIAGLILDISNVLTMLFESFFKPGGAFNFNRLLLADNIGITSLYQSFVAGGASINLGHGLRNLLISNVISLVIIVVALFISISIFWTIISRYGQIFVQVFIAPLQFLWGALPGQDEQIAKWFKSILANALVFPCIYLIINIARFIQLQTQVYIPPGFGDDRGNIATLIGLGILSLAPKIPALLEDALDIAPSGHVAKAGVDPRAAVKSMPIIGRFLG